MKISCIKFKNDNSNFKFGKIIGMDVFEIEDPEKIDEKIKNLKDDNYDTIVISNELASFSNDLVNKYTKDENIKIIITPNKRIKD